jgi:hypothetical protein
MIQLETLKTDVEQGSMGRAFRHGSIGPKCWVYSDVNWVLSLTSLGHSTKGKEVEIPPSRCAMLFAVFGDKRKLGYSRAWSRKRCLFFFTSCSHRRSWRLLYLHTGNSLAGEGVGGMGKHAHFLQTGVSRTLAMGLETPRDGRVEDFHWSRVAVLQSASGLQGVQPLVDRRM